MERSLVARILVALSAALAVAGLLAALVPVARLPQLGGITDWVDLAALTQPGPQLAMQVASVVLAILLARGRHPTPVVLALLALGSVLQLLVSAEGPDVVRRASSSQMPMAALVAWLVGRSLLRRDPERSPTLGEDLACGVVAAAYTVAALSKLSSTGLAWPDGRALALLAQERASDVGSWLSPVRSWVAQQAGLCSALTGAALVVEIAGPLFLLPPLRPAFAACAVGVHVVVGALAGFPQAEWPLAVAGWTVASRRARLAAPDAAEG